MPTQTSLVVWMNGLRVGVWSQGRPGADTFHYDQQWVHSSAARVLSLSLPFTPGNLPHRGDAVTRFFDNLLPDSDAIRRRLRSKFATESTEAFDLLRAIGRDCVGAVQLLSEDETPSAIERVEADPLTDGQVEQAIAAALSSARLLGKEEADDFRISLAGAQEKTALLLHHNKWCRPRGATPTTHIFKLPLGLIGNLQADMHDSVENEWLCSRLLNAYGLPAARCEMAQFGIRKVLVVERFDRSRQEGGWIARLPQEDFCQALGLPSSLKYEADGGPGMRDILHVLDFSSRAQSDKATFLKAQILNWMLAATDGHAKNYSLFHERGGTYRLTPFYDVLSAWPIIGRGAQHLDEHKAKLAMAVRGKNAHWKLIDIQPRHWDAVAKQAGLNDAANLIGELLTATPKVIETVGNEIPREFPARVRDRIFEGLQRSAKRLGA